MHSIFPIETHPPNGKSRTQNERQDVGVDRICVRITECQLNLVLESKGRRKKPTLVERRKQSYSLDRKLEQSKLGRGPH